MHTGRYMQSLQVCGVIYNGHWILISTVLWCDWHHLITRAACGTRMIMWIWLWVFVNGWGLFENWLYTEVSVFLSRHQWLLVWEMYWHIFCLLTCGNVLKLSFVIIPQQRGQNLRSQLIPPFFNVHIVLSHSSYALDPCFGRLTEIQFLRS